MRVVNFAGHLSFLRMSHSASLLTVSNAFVRSMKTCEKAHVLFSVFLVNLFDRKDRVGCAATTTKSTLGIREVLLCN